jgi:fructokinase
LPGVDNPERIKELIGQTAKMSFHLVNENVTAEQMASGRAPNGTEFLPYMDMPGQMLPVYSRVEVSGESLKDSQADFDQNNMPSYEIVANTAIDRISTDFDFENKYNLLYFGTLALREEYNRASIEKIIKNNRFEEIFLDINVRKPFINKENVDFALSKATIVKISDEELPLICDYLFGEELDYKTAAENIAKRYRNLELVLITLGAKGAYCLDVLNNKEHSCGIIHVPVASTVGAGDSFSAAFLYNLMKGEDIDSCLKIASKVSAFVVSKTEAVPDYNINDII